MSDPNCVAIVTFDPLIMWGFGEDTDAAWNDAREWSDNLRGAAEVMATPECRDCLGDRVELVEGHPSFIRPKTRAQ